MKKQSFFLMGATVALLIFTSCQQKGNTPTDNAGDSQTAVEDTVAAAQPADDVKSIDLERDMVPFVQKVYDAILPEYRRCAKGDGAAGPDTESFDKQYLSKRLQKAIAAEEMIDADYWIAAQDFQNPTMTISSSGMIDSSHGYVIVNIKDFDSVQPNKIIVVIEDGELKIDNFCGYYDGEWLKGF